MSDWFIVPEQYHGKVRYPPEGKEVLIWKDGHRYLGIFEHGKWHTTVGPVVPTHWIPIPEGPNEKDNPPTTDY